MGCLSQRSRSSARRRFSLAVLAVGALTMVASACRVPQRYDVTEVIGGLHNPWDLAFAPDGSFFFTERSGMINWGTVSGQRAQIGSPNGVVAAGEGGLMGIAVDPGFAGNHRIYACYMTAQDVRVARFEVAPDNRSIVSQTPIVTGIHRSASGRHSGCRTRFEPGSRLLWVTTGDATEGTSPQNLGVLNGKVLRVTTDGGAVAGNINDGLIYAYGFRNPQGITWRPGDPQPFLIEHGPDCHDEITRIVARGNGGWNPVGAGGSYNENVPMTDFRLGGDVMAPAWDSGCPTIAPSGGTFVTSDLWGVFTGHMAVAVLKGMQLRLIDFDPGQHDQGGAVITNLGRLRVAVEGPDGRLYVLTDADPGRILRVTPVL